MVVKRKVWKSKDTHPIITILDAYEDTSDTVLIRLWSLSGSVIYTFGHYSNTRGWCINVYPNSNEFEWMEIPE